ncbi:hypothetical protein SKAU_G00279880 [Synaphobranchus kaupii]|uniref:Uncharacterized protein n=1 Tax=Synaphobranchus kaupii TaxID=118154 RepID=A0A9Q1EX07_SYNKA|nr:hypothetical protein SKAU_G00279880 [Synaphobranchus kaupii]
MKQIIQVQSRHRYMNMKRRRDYNGSPPHGVIVHSSTLTACRKPCYSKYLQQLTIRVRRPGNRAESNTPSNALASLDEKYGRPYQYTLKEIEELEHLNWNYPTSKRTRP